MQDALDTMHEITKLIKKSPARDAIFKQLKEEMQGGGSPGIRVLYMSDQVDCLSWIFEEHSW